MIHMLAEGLILDCGAGLRRVYYDNIVNFEICPYGTTDVRGVGERLPFRSGVFDAVFSLSVLEHVKDPFACAREVARVLKPGGRLYCVAPFLQPFHGYPHHYYNMTAQGLCNLFRDSLQIDKQEVNTGGMPIFMLTWVLRRWAAGLPVEARQQFLSLKVAELLGDPLDYIEQPFVKEFPEEYRFEMAGRPHSLRISLLDEPPCVLCSHLPRIASRLLQGRRTRSTRCTTSWCIFPIVVRHSSRDRRRLFHRPAPPHSCAYRT